MCRAATGLGSDKAQEECMCVHEHVTGSREVRARLLQTVINLHCIHVCPALSHVTDNVWCPLLDRITSHGNAILCVRYDLDTQIPTAEEVLLNIENHSYKFESIPIKKIDTISC